MEKIDKRKIIWIIIIISISIPIIIELVTFTGLLFNNNKQDNSSIITGKRMSDEILRKTPQTETITKSVVINEGDGEWIFNFNVEINNTSPDRYKIEFLEVITGQDTNIKDNFTQRVSPKEKKSLKTNWTIPEGEIPSQIRFIVSYNNQTKDGIINLGSIPVQTRR